MMAIDPLFKSNGLFQRHQLGNRCLLGGSNYNSWSTWAILLGIILLVILVLWHGIDPFECLFTRLLPSHLVLYDLAHLRVQKCVPYDHFFFLEILLEALATFEWKVVEIERKGPESSIAQSLLKLLQLLDKSASDLQVRPSRIQELKCFEHWPPVLAHKISC